jgi:hypothetical protein
LLNILSEEADDAGIAKILLRNCWQVRIHMLVLLPPFKWIFLHKQAFLTKVLAQFLPQTHHQCTSCFINWPNFGFLY